MSVSISFFVTSFNFGLIPPFINLAVGYLELVDGFEPPTSGLQGSRSANWTTPAYLIWWRIADLNRWPPACKAGILPTELIPRIKLVAGVGLEPTTFCLWGRRADQLLHPALFGSHGRTRTCNSLINGQMLYQLNYARIYGGSMGNRTLNSAVTGRYFSQLNYRAIWWAGKDLNLWTVAGTVLQTACFNQTCIPTHMVTGTRFELVITTLKGWWLRPLA